jgi:hypothetical protein
MDEDEVRSERTFSLRKINPDPVTVIAEEIKLD